MAYNITWCARTIRVTAVTGKPTKKYIRTGINRASTCAANASPENGKILKSRFLNAVFYWLLCRKNSGLFFCRTDKSRSITINGRLANHDSERSQEVDKLWSSKFYNQFGKGRSRVKFLWRLRFIRSVNGWEFRLVWTHFWKSYWLKNELTQRCMNVEKKRLTDYQHFLSAYYTRTCCEACAKVSCLNYENYTFHQTKPAKFWKILV